MIEVLNHASMTEGVGLHPSFNGVKRIVVTGLGEPKISSNGKVTIDGDFASLALKGMVEQDGQHLIVRLP